MVADLTTDESFDKYVGRYGWVYDNGGNYRGEYWNWYIGKTAQVVLLRQAPDRVCIVRIEGRTPVEMWSGTIRTSDDFDQVMSSIAHSMGQQRVTWKHYVLAAGMAFFVPFLALLLQTGWTLWAHPYRLYQASLSGEDLTSPMFWLGDAFGGLLIFLILCLVIKRPLYCWIVVIGFLAGFTILLVLQYNSVAIH